MKTLGSPIFAALPASAAAGPVFLSSLYAAEIYSFSPQPVPIEPAYLGIFLLMLVPAAIFGFLISIVPNVIGAHILSIAGESSETARAPIFWIGIGAALGFGFAFLFGVLGYSVAGTFAVVMTSAVCAGICRARTAWGDRADQA